MIICPQNLHVAAAVLGRRSSALKRHAAITQLTPERRYTVLREIGETPTLPGEAGQVTMFGGELQRVSSLPGLAVDRES